MKRALLCSRCRRLRAAPDFYYTINLSWTWGGGSEQKGCSVPAYPDEHKDRKFDEVLGKWHKLHKGRDQFKGLQFWTDQGAYLPTAGVAQRRCVAEEIMSAGDSNSTELTLAKSLIKHLSQGQWGRDHLYILTDLRRMLEAWHDLTQRRSNLLWIFVWTQLDVEPVAYDQLFTQDVLDVMKKQGYMFVRSSQCSLENSFFLLSNRNSKPGVLHHLLHGYLRPCVQLFTPPLRNLRRMPPRQCAQIAFNALNQWLKMVWIVQNYSPQSELRQRLLKSDEAMYEFMTRLLEYTFFSTGSKAPPLLYERDDPDRNIVNPEPQTPRHPHVVAPGSSFHQAPELD